jgi:hypothetical protein
MFQNLRDEHIQLENIVSIQSQAATHLRFRIQRSQRWLTLSSSVTLPGFATNAVPSRSSRAVGAVRPTLLEGGDELLSPRDAELLWKACRRCWIRARGGSRLTTGSPHSAWPPGDTSSRPSALEHPRSLPRAATTAPTTTLHTLYATVHLFEQLGLIRLLHLPDGARVELEPVDHKHGYCERCGMVVNFGAPARLESTGSFHARSGGRGLRPVQPLLPGLAGSTRRDDVSRRYRGRDRARMNANRASSVARRALTLARAGVPPTRRPAHAAERGRRPYGPRARI